MMMPKSSRCGNIYMSSRKVRGEDDYFIPNAAYRRCSLDSEARIKASIKSWKTVLGGPATTLEQHGDESLIRIVHTSRLCWEEAPTQLTYTPKTTFRSPLSTRVTKHDCPWYLVAMLRWSRVARK